MPPAAPGKDGMTEREGAQVERLPRIYLNGFPKSGLHLAVLMARTITTDPSITPPWTGSFARNAWSTQWLPLEPIMAELRLIKDDTWLKGHMGWMPTAEQYLYWHGVSVAFIYRDLRDVLVSQSYHVIDEDDQKFFHPDKDIYRAMGHEERLMACLCGVGPYAGLFDRWELYAPWLQVPWVFPLRYEDMMERREETARAFLRYVWDRTAWGYAEPTVPEMLEGQYVEAMVKNMERKEYSTTFRKGGSGGWREEFTPRVKDEFKARGGDWLVRLGYEEDDSW